MCAKVLASLPGYSSVLVKQQNPQSLEAKGNAMEMAVGLAYTCYREFTNLPGWHHIEFKDGMQEKGRDMWASLWDLFEQMGLTVTTRMHGPLAGRAEEDRPAKKRRTEGPAGDSQAGQWQQQPRQQQLEPLPVSPRAIEWEYVGEFHWDGIVRGNLKISRSEAREPPFSTPDSDSSRRAVFF